MASTTDESGVAAAFSRPSSRPSSRPTSTRINSSRRSTSLVLVARLAESNPEIMRLSHWSRAAMVFKMIRTTFTAIVGQSGMYLGAQSMWWAFTLTNNPGASGRLSSYLSYLLCTSTIVFLAIYYLLRSYDKSLFYYRVKLALRQAEGGDTAREMRHVNVQMKKLDTFITIVADAAAYAMMGTIKTTLFYSLDMQWTPDNGNFTGHCNSTTPRWPAIRQHQPAGWKCRPQTTLAPVAAQPLTRACS